MIKWLCRLLAGFFVSAAIAACTSRLPSDFPAESPQGLAIAFDDVVAPDVFEFEGAARVGPEEAGPGLWAAVPGLESPERGLLQNPSTGRTTLAALFRAPPGATVISADAARALGLGAVQSAPVVIRAVRSEVRLSGSSTGL